MSSEEATQSLIEQARDFFELHFETVTPSPYASYTIESPQHRFYLGIAYVLSPIIGLACILFGIYPNVIFPLPFVGIAFLAFFGVLSFSLYYERVEIENDDYVW